MSTLHRVRLYARYATPLYPFTPFAVHERGTLRTRPGYDRAEQWVDPGAGHIAIPFEGGPRWATSREDGIRAAIAEVEAAAASIAAVLDELRQGLLQESAQGD